MNRDVKRIGRLGLVPAPQTREWRCCKTTTHVQKKPTYTQENFQRLTYARWKKNCARQAYLGATPEVVEKRVAEDDFFFDI